MQIWLRFQGSARFTKNIHAGKPGWTFIREFLNRVLGSSGGQPAFSYKRIEILPKKIGIREDLGKVSHPALPGLTRLIQTGPK